VSLDSLSYVLFSLLHLPTPLTTKKKKSDLRLHFKVQTELENPFYDFTRNRLNMFLVSVILWNQGTPIYLESLTLYFVPYFILSHHILSF